MTEWRCHHLAQSRWYWQNKEPPGVFKPKAAAFSSSAHAIDTANNAQPAIEPGMQQMIKTSSAGAIDPASDAAGRRLVCRNGTGSELVQIEIRPSNEPQATHVILTTVGFCHRVILPVRARCRKPVRH